MSTGFLTVGVIDLWALDLVLLGWPKQAAAQPCTLTLYELQLGTLLSFLIPSQLVTVGREPSSTWPGVTHVPGVRTFLHSSL